MAVQSGAGIFSRSLPQTMKQIAVIGPARWATASPTCSPRAAIRSPWWTSPRSGWTRPQPPSQEHGPPGGQGEDDRGRPDASLARIATNTDLATGVKQADLVVEAATENVDLKLKLFRDIDANAPNGCILATNTSSISITRIAAATKRPDHVIGMHFMNPVPVMKLVEVIRLRHHRCGDRYRGELSKAIGKVPVTVNDYAGSWPTAS